MTEKSRNINGYTDSHLLNLTIQKSLILDSNADTDTWTVQEDIITSDLEFNRNVNNVETTALSINTDGDSTFTGDTTFNGVVNFNIADLILTDTTNDNPTVSFFNTNSTLGSRIRIRALDDDFEIRERDGNDIVLFTNDTEKMRIESGGNVGISENDPDALLHISGTDNRKILLESTDSTATYMEVINSVATAGTRFGIDANERAIIENKENTDLIISTNDLERARILAGGNFGIGTNSADALFHVEGAANTVVKISSSGTDGNARIGIYCDRTTTTGNVGLVRWFNEGNSADIEMARIQVEKLASTDNESEMSLWTKTGGSIAKALTIEANGNVETENNEINSRNLFYHTQRNSTQATATAVAEDINWNNEIINNSGFVETAGSIAIPVDGLYHITCWVQWEADNTGSRRVDIITSGFTIATSRQVNAGATDSVRMSLSGYANFDEDDTFSVEVLQNSGGNINVVLAELQVYKVGRKQ